MLEMLSLTFLLFPSNWGEQSVAFSSGDLSLGRNARFRSPTAVMSAAPLSPSSCPKASSFRCRPSVNICKSGDAGKIYTTSSPENAGSEKGFEEGVWGGRRKWADHYRLEAMEIRGTRCCIRSPGQKFGNAAPLTLLLLLLLPANE